MKGLTMKRIVFALVALLVLSGVAFAEPKRITRANVADPDRLEVILNAMDTEIDALRTLCNQQRTALLGDIVLTETALAIGSATTCVSYSAFAYAINGTKYELTASATGKSITSAEITTIAQNKYGAIAFQVGTNGTVDIVQAPLNSTGYDSAALAAAALPAVAADHARMGYITVMDTAGAFTPGPTALSSGTVTEAYVNTGTLFSGVTSSAVSEQTTRGK